MWEKQAQRSTSHYGTRRFPDPVTYIRNGKKPNVQFWKLADNDIVFSLKAETTILSPYLCEEVEIGETHALYHNLKVWYS